MFRQSETCKNAFPHKMCLVLCEKDSPVKREQRYNKKGLQVVLCRACMAPVLVVKCSIQQRKTLSTSVSAPKASFVTPVSLSVKFSLLFLQNLTIFTNSFADFGKF